MAQQNRKPYLFLVLVLILSIPLYLLNHLLPNLALPFGLPPSVVMIFIPALVAGIFVWREQKAKGFRAWVASVFDMATIRRKPWLFFSILFVPLLSIFAVYLSSGAIPSGETPNLATVLITVAIFWFGSIFEELGWTAYATGPLQKRHGVFIAGLIIGLVWQIWHIVPFLQMDRSFDWVFWHCIVGVGHRIIMGYIFARSNGTTSPALFYHAALNYMPELLPGQYTTYDPEIHAYLVWIVVLVFVAGEKLSKRKNLID